MVTRAADEIAFTAYEQGEREALLQVRSFITKHGTREVDAYCAQRLHDIRMDAKHRAANPAVGIHTGTSSE